MNSVINGRIATEVGFDRIHIPPCAHDGGTSAGAAAYMLYHQLFRNRPEPLANAFLGPSYSDEAIEQTLQRSGVPFRRCNPDQRAAELISGGDVVGWFQGAGEFGPRALGARSILGDARDVKMRAHISQVVKERESFRPLAPAVLAEHYAQYFPDLPESPYMTYVGRASAEASKTIPAAVHVDGTARPQSVDRQRCPLFHSLISHVYALTGVPAVINTSFNMSGEPIVRSPADAVRTLYSSRLRHLVIGSFHVCKDSASPAS
jgi:carbamoyltransferase